MKKMTVFALMLAVVALVFAVGIFAKDVYLEPIPDELKVTGDTATHFVVFEEEKYFSYSGGTISGLNNSVMEEDMSAAGIDASLIGSTYITRFNFPAYCGGTLITYVNLNAIKTNKYFRGVCGYVQLAGTVNKVHDMNECTTQLRCIDFGKDSQVSVIPLMFCPNSRKLLSIKNFPRNLTSVESQAFNGCYGAFRGELYLNATTVNDLAFNNAISNVTSLILGPNIKTLGRQSLCVRLNEFSSFYYPNDGLIAIKSIEFQCDVSKVNFYAQGVDIGVFYFPVNTDRSPYSHLKCIVLSHPDNASKVVEGSVFNDFTAEGVTILFNDRDGLDDFVTTSHSYSSSEVYYESYLKEGEFRAICDKCQRKEATSIPAFFTCLGYSKNLNGGDVVLGFAVNKSAVNEYAPESFSYGLFAASKTKLRGEYAFDNNGEARDGVIKADMTKAVYDIIQIKVTGLITDDYKNAQLALGAYVIEGEDVKISYLQGQAPENEDKYYFVSYSQL